MRRDIFQIQKSILKSLATLLLLAFFTTVDAAQQAIDRIAAIVNDGIITERQVQNELHNIRAQLRLAHAPVPAGDLLREKALDHLIDKELQLQLAKNAGLEIDDATVKRAIEDIANRNHVTMEVLKSKLAAEGINFATYCQDIREQMLMHQVQNGHLASSVAVSDSEIKQVQSKIKPMQPGTKRYHVLDIYIPLPENAAPDTVNKAQAKAKLLMDRIQGGADFSSLAASEAAASKLPNGGDFGWLALAQLPDLFAQKVQTLSAGQVAGPIQTGNGLHIIKLVGVEGGEGTHHYSEKTHIRHILIKTDKTTNDEIAKMRLLQLKEKLQKGADFAEIANANSQDNMTNKKGGELDWIPAGILDPNFEKIMNQLKVGQIGGPVKTRFGWHLMQVLGRKRVEDTQDLLFNQARDLAYQQKIQQSLPGWLQQLRSTAYIKKYTNN